MTLTQTAATTLVPLLVRVVLAAIMVPTGWTMLTERMSEVSERSDTSELSDPSDSSDPSDTSDPSDSSDLSDTSDLSDASDASDASDTSDLSDASDTSDASDPSDPSDPLDASDTLDTPDPSDPSDASDASDPSDLRRLHEYADTFEAAGWPIPVVLAWTLALAQLVGGGMLLIGLATRLWGLLFAIAAGAFFAIDAWPIVLATGGVGLEWPDWVLVTSLGGLVVLSTILVLAGGGAVSIDRGLFRSRPSRSAAPATPSAGTSRGTTGHV